MRRFIPLILACALVAFPAFAQQAQSPELQACQWKVQDDQQLEAQLRVALVKAQDRINELQAKLNAAAAPAAKPAAH